MSSYIAPMIVGDEDIVLRQDTGMLYSKRFCGLDALLTPPLTTTAEPTGIVPNPPVDVVPVPPVSGLIGTDWSIWTALLPWYVALMTLGDRRLPFVYGLVPKFQSLVEFHLAITQFGFVLLPKFWKTYLICSPIGPITDHPEGTPVTLNKASPVSASNKRPKFDVASIAGKTPCWLGSS